MKTKQYILTIGFLMILFGCGQTNSKTENSELNYDSGKSNRDTFALPRIDTGKVDHCNFTKYLDNPLTSNLAKKLFNGEQINLDKEDPLFLLDSLKAKDKQSRSFYFRVITNSYKSSDGYYSEGLGDAGKTFIENNTIEFASYFDNKNCFTDTDLETWADIAILEFDISGENNDGTLDKKIVDDYIQKLNLNCKDCSPTQKITIDNFSKLLKLKWQDILKKANK